MTSFFLFWVVVVEEGQPPGGTDAHTAGLGSQSSPDSLSCTAWLL